MSREMDETARSLGCHRAARRCLKAGDLDEAKKFIERAGRCILQNSGCAFADRALAEQHLLYGEWFVKKGQFPDAVDDFVAALNIWTVDPYSDGRAEAYLGIAKSFWGSFHPIRALYYFFEAVRTQPGEVLKKIPYLHG